MRRAARVPTPPEKLASIYPAEPYLPQSRNTGFPGKTGFFLTSRQNPTGFRPLTWCRVELIVVRITITISITRQGPSHYESTDGPTLFQSVDRSPLCRKWRGLGRERLELTPPACAVGMQHFLHDDFDA